MLCTQDIPAFLILQIWARPTFDHLLLLSFAYTYRQVEVTAQNKRPCRDKNGNSKPVISRKLRSLCIIVGTGAEWAQGCIIQSACRYVLWDVFSSPPSSILRPTLYHFHHLLLLRGEIKDEGKGRYA